MTIVVSPSVPIDVESFSAADVTTSHGVPVSVTWLAAENSYMVAVAPWGAGYEGTATATFNTSSVTVDGVPGPDRTISTTFEVDTVRPTATIHLSSTDLRRGDSSTVMIETSEPVTGLAVAAMDVPNGEILELSGYGLMWIGTFVPDPDVSDDSNTITLDDAAMRDAHGNAGEGWTVSGVYAVRTTVPSASVSVAVTGFSSQVSASAT